MPLLAQRKMCPCIRIRFGNIAVFARLLIALWVVIAVSVLVSCSIFKPNNATVAVSIIVTAVCATKRFFNSIHRPLASDVEVRKSLGPDLHRCYPPIKEKKLGCIQNDVQWCSVVSKLLFYFTSLRQFSPLQE